MPTEGPSPAAERTRLWWRHRLGSALRTALACSIVGCTTLYGPAPLRRLLTYPAFAYVTTILIVSDATLGKAARGCWHAVCASVQVLAPAILSLYVIRPERFTEELAAVAVAVAVGAFFVALPEWSHLLTKRIAFGQLVIVYVGAVVHGAETGVVMHPLHVASCTALGAVASVLAMLLPFPRLAYWEVRKACETYAENASDRLNLYVEAITTQDSSHALDFIYQAKPLSRKGSKIIQSITDNKEGMKLERPDIWLLRAKYVEPGRTLQDMEMPIRGMDIALASCPSFPLEMVNEQLIDVIQTSKAQIGLKLEQAKCSAPFNATTAPENKLEVSDKYLDTPKISTSYKDLPALFFLFCMELLQDDSSPHQSPASTEDEKPKCKRTWNNILTIRPDNQRLAFAVKCSISLGLAVLCGMKYNKINGYWSGLTIAISFVTGRQPTFTVANARAQGTAMGSIYGLIWAFILQKYLELWFVPLLPWIIFSSFLRHSRMYGQAGAISAVIGASLILGRKHYGPPTDFAIARITEASIGLLCLILVEFLFQPTRAATMAKVELSKSLGALHDCIHHFYLSAREKSMPTSELREKQKKLKSCVDELEEFITEAEQEPNFWFLPFHGACYRKLLGSLSNMADLLFFSACTMEYLSQVSQRSGVAWREAEDNLSGDLETFQEKVGSTIKCLQQITRIKSLKVLENKWQEKSKSNDVELGKSPNMYLGMDEDEVQRVVSSCLQHSEKIADTIKVDEVGEAVRSKMVLYLSSIGFCISRLLRETQEIEKEMRELVKWENPSAHINLQEISSKIKDLCT